MSFSSLKVLRLAINPTKMTVYNPSVVEKAHKMIDKGNLKCFFFLYIYDLDFGKLKSG